MAQTALFTRPMARKKRVIDKYCPNSYRVISSDAETFGKQAEPGSFSMPEQNLIGQPPDSNRPMREHRYNQPNPGHVGFLRHDVKLLNEPVCNVYSVATHHDQHNWWPNDTSESPPINAPYSLDSTVRQDYQWRGSEVIKSTRHSSNPNKIPALGSVPVNFLRDSSGKQRLLREGISYEHQFDSRQEPSYPNRAKRHGSFVWDSFSKDHAERMIKYYGNQIQCNQTLSNPITQMPQDENLNEKGSQTADQDTTNAKQEEPAALLPPIS